MKPVFVWSLLALLLAASLLAWALTGLWLIPAVVAACEAAFVAASVVLGIGKGPI